MFDWLKEYVVVFIVIGILYFTKEIIYIYLTYKIERGKISEKI